MLALSPPTHRFVECAEAVLNWVVGHNSLHGRSLFALGIYQHLGNGLGGHDKLFQVVLVFKKMQADYECAASQTRDEVKLLHAWVDPCGFRRSGSFG